MREVVPCSHLCRVVSGTSNAKEAAFLVLYWPFLKALSANCTLCHAAQIVVNKIRFKLLCTHSSEISFRFKHFSFL